MIMRKLLTALITLPFVFLFVSCSTNSTNSTTLISSATVAPSTINSTTFATTKLESVTPITTVTTTQTTTVNTTTTIATSQITTSSDMFAKIENVLNDLKLKYETIIPFAAMVGATSGKKYKLSDGVIELYKFDKSSDAYAKIVKDKAFTIEGFGTFPVDVKNEYAIIVGDTIAKRKEILAAFNN